MRDGYASTRQISGHVLPIKLGEWLHCDEELRSVRVLPGIGHRQQAWRNKQILALKNLPISITILLFPPEF